MAATISHTSIMTLDPVVRNEEFLWLSCALQQTRQPLASLLFGLLRHLGRRWLGRLELVNDQVERPTLGPGALPRSDRGRVRGVVARPVRRGCRRSFGEELLEEGALRSRASLGDDRKP